MARIYPESLRGLNLFYNTEHFIKTVMKAWDDDDDDVVVVVRRSEVTDNDDVCEGQRSARPVSSSRCSLYSFML